MRLYRKLLHYALPVSVVCMMLTSIGCSYMSDMVEGAVTKRSSFSLDAEYNKSASTITLTWDETASSDNFAGWEIYRSEYPDSEFSPYILVASRWRDESGTTVAAGDGDNLHLTARSGFTLNNLVDLESNNGRYFFRVGIITWDDNEKDRTVKNGYVLNGPVDELWNTNDNYNANTSIDEISGFAYVNIE